MMRVHAEVWYWRDPAQLLTPPTNLIGYEKVWEADLDFSFSFNNNLCERVFNLLNAEYNDEEVDYDEVPRSMTTHDAIVFTLGNFTETYVCGAIAWFQINKQGFSWREPNISWRELDR